MTQLDKIASLFKFGWKVYGTLEQSLKSMTAEQLEQLVQQYAMGHGLSSVTDVDSHLREVRYCKHPDVMPISSQVCKWSALDITWDVVAFPQQFTKQQFVEHATEAFHRWSQVCGIRPVYTSGNPACNIIMNIRAIDGAFGVLAESELPCGNVSQCGQWYDTGENWSAFDGPGGNSLDIVRVMTHELGHALGMNHIGAGNLLAPTYSQTVFVPQKGDIAEMTGRYGLPIPPVAPTPVNPVPGDPEEIILRFKGPFTADGYRITKLVA